MSAMDALTDKHVQTHGAMNALTHKQVQTHGCNECFNP